MPRQSASGEEEKREHEVVRREWSRPGGSSGATVIDVEEARLFKRERES